MRNIKDEPNLSEKKIDELKNNYLSGGIGYGSAKELLYQLILEKFKSRIWWRNSIN